MTAAPPGGGPNPNLLGFRNTGGLFGKGVCWWHSRFTRNALYLACFQPELPRPGETEVRRILGNLMKAKAVTAIPGYSNLREFSLDHRAAIQRTLERRQLFEGLFLFAWVNGLSGSSRTGPCRMKALMDRIHTESAKGLVYAKLQTPGLDAHSIIVTGTERLPEGGYEVRYLDSNSAGENVLYYRVGYSHLTLETGMTGVPYVQRSGELCRIRKLVRRFSSEGVP
ncbi:MAG: hypothetical protein JXR55_04985 [Candidatus Fermentibacteraceae bacterium]|nr:hypothetical protein [Candidatus Fermentibacteraceae bacterium]